jgi:N-acetylglucosaminyldiphosphoundecaprenol N-acetyl-beta-D-mannosaminyltransferase
LRLAYENQDFHTVVKNADFVFADGMPVIWLSKLRTQHTGVTAPLNERVPGCDIVFDLCKRSHEKGYRIFMLGAGPGVAEEAKIKLEQMFPNIQIVGTYAPAPQELTVPEWSDGIVETINHSGADILFVALGAPKQETWIQQNRHKLNPYVIIPCGASIDFIAGVQKKSPKWLGKIGLEWLFRLACNPARLFNRYILNDFPFLFKAYYRTRLLQGYDLL